MKVAFIAMPYNADTDWERRQNIEAAARVAAEMWNDGWAVICPHTNSAFFGGSAPEENFYEGYKELVKRSDVVVAGPGWQKSAGAQAEVELAYKLGIGIIDWEME